MARNSDNDEVNLAVIAIICGMEPDPYPCATQASPRVKRGLMHQLRR